MSYARRFARANPLPSFNAPQHPLPKHTHQSAASDCESSFLNQAQDHTTPALRTPLTRFPPSLHRKLTPSPNLKTTESTLRAAGLHTVCEQARCPNRLDCFSKKTATFLTLGKVCTRRCGFCSIEHAATPLPPDPDEGARIAKTCKTLGLKHIVLTMVARDDLADGGAGALNAIIQQLRSDIPQVTIELLTTDFNLMPQALDILLEEPPEVFNHNIESIRRLSPRIRNIASHERSLQMLSLLSKHARSLPGQRMKVKSGLMVGLGENRSEVLEAIDELAQAGCDIITIGQYLQPSRKHLLVKRFVEADEFEEYALYGKSLGIEHMYCGPFIRSSYNAELFV